MDNSVSDTGRFRAFWLSLPPLEQSELMARAGSAVPEEAYAHHKSFLLGMPVRPISHGEMRCTACLNAIGFYQERCKCGEPNPNMELHNHV